ncbi:MAG: hypothetical protein PHG36_06105 [Dehalococcoidia bacterium]|nr:hypothetical protein [Dehalococcoidia bacterium]
MGDINILIKQFQGIDTSDLPDFYNFEKPLEMGLWILWAAKDKLNMKKLTAEEIALIIRDVREISITSLSISRALARAGTKIHSYHDAEKVYFEIMRPGKEHLRSFTKEGIVEVFYFESNMKYSSKKLLKDNIFSNLKGDLRILDPYCGVRTLDVLRGIKNKTVKFLTNVDHQNKKAIEQFLRELQDFKSENQNIEFRNYPYTDIHDRYVLSPNHLVILGHSIKDLGSKESFAIVLANSANQNIVDAVSENFNSRWQKSKVL